MSLSSDLISQFVKMTNDKKDEKKETTVKGTVVKDNGKTYVQLDGSDLLTPVTTTTNVADGARVTVLIKNHSAIITGSTSSPSASISDVGDVANKITEFEIAIGDKVDTLELDAANARIDTLQSDNVTIHETLNAANANIETLQADNVEVNKKLTAAEADIESLETTKLDADIANATYATIANLNAEKARIDTLEAAYGEFDSVVTGDLSAMMASINKLQAEKLDANTATITYAKISDLDAAEAEIDTLQAGLADIDTLIFGSASGTTIQSSFANAVIAQLGDAQIKSAMIEGLAASKITSGDIITNNVRVKSQNGLLLISDETIQISDNSRVRVQIGKDAANDYSINVWDASGNLMFSKGGITDSAIKSAIIRNDMVSDTANIAAHKLDIDSLFEEINDSTKTIKSTRIYLDDEKQTLDVAFKEMSEDISGLDNIVTSQGTQISAIQGQISSKVWQQDIDTATGDMTTQFTALEQELDTMSAKVASNSSSVTEVNNKFTSLEAEVDQFKTTVSETYAIQSEVDSVLSRVSTAEATISQHASSIGLMATKTELDTAKSELTAAINVKENSILSSVSSTYATKTALDSTNSNVTAARTAADNAQADIDGLQIGGRNLLKNSRHIQLRSNNASLYPIASEMITEDGREFTRYTRTSVDSHVTTMSLYSAIPSTNITEHLTGREATFSFLIRCSHETVTTTFNALYTNSVTYTWSDQYVNHSIGSEWKRVSVTATISQDYVWDEASVFRFNPLSIVIPDGEIENFYLDVCEWKIELGNRATDWTPAPIDTASSEDLSQTKSALEATDEKVESAASLVEQLSNSLAQLVTDGQGTSLMTQTEAGWTFATTDIQAAINATSEGLDALVNDLGDTNSVVSILQQAVADLGTIAEYVKIGTYDGQPCIELGEGDSEFKLRITNTQIMFMEGSGVPAYFTNQSMHINKAVIEEELQQGNFVWKVRSNGNMGLIWKG